MAELHKAVAAPLLLLSLLPLLLLAHEGKAFQVLVTILVLCPKSSHSGIAFRRRPWWRSWDRPVQVCRPRSTLRTMTATWATT